MDERDLIKKAGFGPKFGGHGENCGVYPRHQVPTIPIFNGILQRLQGSGGSWA